MSIAIFEKEYEVNSIYININKRLGLFGMLGVLQDAGTIHAEVMGAGIESMQKNNAFWVFIQQQLKMKKWPKWQDHIRVKTWPRALDGLKAYRDYEIYMGDEKIGECVGVFMVLNGTTRKPVRPKLDEAIRNNVATDILTFTPERISLPENMTLERSLIVRNSDLDMNNHVNNTKYAQWILDTIPLQYHLECVVEDFDINFIAETHLGDEIEILMDIKSHPGNKLESFYKGVRKSDQKVAFAARIISKQN